MTCEVAPGADLVDATPEHVALILEKLMDNAVKFGDKLPVRVAVSVALDGEAWVRFTVQDNGVGVPHESYDRIFAGFFQVEEHVTGSRPGWGWGCTWLGRSWRPTATLSR